MSGLNYENIPNEGLVAWYPFNGNANDESINANNGIVEGAQLTTDRNGNEDKAYLFDGINDFIKIAGALPIATQFTMSFWAYSENEAGYSNVICDGGSSHGGNDFLIVFRGNSLGIRADKNASLNYEDYSPAELQDLDLVNRWVHVVWVLTPGYSKIVVDGVERIIINESGSNEGYHDDFSFIGARQVWGSPDYFFKGKIDDIVMYNRVLSETEIQELYSGNTEIISDPPVSGTATSISPICAGSTATLTLTGSSGNIQWQQSVDGATNWINVSGGTGEMAASYTTGNLLSASYYRAVVSKQDFPEVYSNLLNITLKPLPASAGAISGLTSVCQGTNLVQYYVPAIPNASSYYWTLPTGATGTSTNGTISVNYGLSSVSGNIQVSGRNSCGDGEASTLSVAIKPLPQNPGTIRGSAVVCQGQTSVMYDIPLIANATSYIWTVPVGAKGNGTGSANKISVDFFGNFVSGEIEVYGKNTCGSGVKTAIEITGNLFPSAAGTINGVSKVCKGQSVNYMVAPISNATAYIWSLPEGAAGTSTTNTITVEYGMTSVSGEISVKGNNSCGDGVAFSLPVTVSQHPESAGKISGSTIVCQGRNSVSYTVAAISNASSYVWTLPQGARGTSKSNSINVDYGLNSKSGNLLVAGNNECGEGQESAIPITVNEKPETPSITINGDVLHSDASLGNDWYNQKGIINGAKNQEYKVKHSDDYYAVVTIKGCSSEPSNTISYGITGLECVSGNEAIKVYPNPVSDMLVIEFEGNQERISLEIFNAMGQRVFNGNLYEREIILTTGFSPGVYLLKLESRGDVDFRKVVKE